MLAFHELTLIRRAQIAEDGYALTFDVPQPLSHAFRFIPGQHVAVRAVVNGRPLRRNYSIVSTSTSDAERSAVRSITLGVRVQGEMSRYLTRHLAVSGRLQVMPPGGSFHPRLDPAHAKRYVAIAAGSGITPVLSIVASILGAEPRSEIVLCYANRTVARAMFLEEVQALKNRHPARVTLNFVMSREPQESGLYNGRPSAETIEALPGRLLAPGAVDEYFLCGPQGMLDGLLDAIRARGIAVPIHLERFGLERRSAAAEDMAGCRGEHAGTSAGMVAPHSAEPHSAAVAAATTRVTIIMDGRRRGFTMTRNGQSLLEAAEQAGIELPFACRAGVCSTCRAKLVAGEAAMSCNHALEASEVAAGHVLCCQARPSSECIELDYDAR